MTHEEPFKGPPNAKESDRSISGAIFDALSARMEDFGPSFAKYVEEYGTDRWLLFSDYVLQHPGRPNDAFIFTVLPAGNYLPALTADFQGIAKKDFKDIQEVSEPMLRLLSDKRLFTFCFVVDPTRVITRNVSIVQGML